VKEFSNITDFVKHLATVAVATRAAEHKILEKAAVMVEKRAKQKIGTYQEEIGPFIAWPELAESTKADRVRQGYSEDDPGLRSGEMRESIGHQVQGPEAQIGSNDDKLVYFELGTSRQPPRSVLGGAMAEKLPEILTMTRFEYVAALTGQQVFQGMMPIGLPEKD
jgi:hypothetical protein